MENKKGGGFGDYNEGIGDALEDFFKAYNSGDRLNLYTFFDTEFQSLVPLNDFLYHPDYVNMELGSLVDILSIELSKLKNDANVRILIKKREKIEVTPKS